MKTLPILCSPYVLLSLLLLPGSTKAQLPESTSELNEIQRQIQDALRQIQQGVGIGPQSQGILQEDPCTLLPFLPICDDSDGENTSDSSNGEAASIQLELEEDDS